jgi:lipopolysaccharide transport system ATP-binding protein
MSAMLLRVEDLGKVYRSYPREWQRVLSWFGWPGKPDSEHWALRHVSFNIGRGEAVGIVGQNGAGKSTLLKLVTGTARANEGRVSTTGRIAAILELGMGFNPDLSGRENCRHAAGLMGHSQADIERLLPEIEAFAEVGDYFDQPVRT